MNKTISVEILIKNGYIEYKKNFDLEKNSKDRLFQKKFTDENGTKYFINCKYYYFLNNENQWEFWDFSMQIETLNGAVDISTVQWFNQNGIYSKRTIKDVEIYFEDMWIANKCPYYEKYTREQ